MNIDNIKRYDKHSKKDDNKIFESISKSKVKCKNCGHTIPIVNFDRLICNHCGHWVYKNDNIEFKYKIKESMKK